MKRLLLAMVGLAVMGTPAAGQSLFNAAGLGLPIEALDGRARALGNLGIGLRGGSFLPTDPAALGYLAFSTGVMAAQPSWVDYASEGGVTGKVQGNRFPLLGIAYPFFQGMMSVQIGAFLDQQCLCLVDERVLARRVSGGEEKGERVQQAEHRQQIDRQTPRETVNANHHRRDKQIR